MAELKANGCDTHLVVKREDINKYLNTIEQNMMAELVDRICECRAADGKRKVNSYYICNVDEDYSWKVIEDIIDGEDVKEGVKRWLFKQGQALRFRLGRLRITILIRFTSKSKKTS